MLALTCCGPVYAAVGRSEAIIGPIDTARVLIEKTLALVK